MTVESLTMKPDDDSLWYDRAEPDAPDGPLLWAMAFAFVGAVAVYRLPAMIYDAWGKRIWQLQRLQKRS